MSTSPSKNQRGSPLAQLSPERVNGRTASKMVPAAFSASSPIRKRNDEGSIFASSVPMSPSLPEISMVRAHMRTNNDVSGLVKRFEHLDVRDRDAEQQEKKRKYDEAVDRANLAREEAETQVKKYKEELRAQHKDFEESKDRERRACKRIDVLMEEFARAKEQWSSQSSIYEKEVRKARKEAFKSSSAILKLQEEGKSVKNELRATHTKLDLAMRKAAACEDEKFTAQYQLAAVQEELEKLQSALRIAQEERETMKRSLKEDEIAKMAAEGSIALPSTMADDHDLLDSPLRSRSPVKRTLLTECGGRLDAGERQAMDVESLRRYISIERRRRRAAEDLADFVQMECRFRCCRCARRRSASPSRQRETTQTQTGNIIETADQQRVDAGSYASTPSPTTPVASIDLQNDVLLPQDSGVLDDASQRASSSPQGAVMTEADSIQADDPFSPQVGNTIQADHEPVDQNIPEADMQSNRGSFRTVTTTTKVPMLFSPAKKSPTAMAEEQPVIKSEPQQANSTAKAYPFDREAALAAIAYRRGRAKSFAQGHMTSKQALVDTLKDRRDISAPAIAQ